MSTKIYNAYKFNGTVEQLLPRLFRFREIVIKDCARYLGGKITFKEGYGYREAMSNMANTIRTRQRDALNVECSIVIYSHPRIKGTLFQLFGVDDWSDFRGSMLSRKLSKRGVVDWHYQNSTDKPDRVTEKEWRQREREWSLIFKTHPAPAGAGLTFQLIDECQAGAIVYGLSGKE